MAQITCDGFTFESDDADVFCFLGCKTLTAQRIFLLSFAALIGLAFFFPTIRYWSIIVSAALVAFVYIRTMRDMEKGFFTAIVKDRMCIRTGHGEATVLIEDIDQVVFHINSTQLVMKDGQRIDMNANTEDHAPIYQWMYLNLKTPYKNPPRT